MNTVEMWQVLEIEPTKEEDKIVAAYRTKVVTVNPEDDAEGFMRLREAFEMAINYAREDDVLEGEEGEKPEAEKTDIDRHIDKLDEIYKDIFSRRDVEKWKEWLSDPLCLELDTSDNMREATLVYLMRHFMLPMEVWQLLDQTFSLEEDKDVLAEKFPEDFLGFVVYRIHNEDFVDYEFFMPREEYNEIYSKVLKPIEIPEKPTVFEPDEYECMDDSYIRSVSITQAEAMAYLTKVYEQSRGELPEDVNIDENLDILCNIVRYLKAFDIWHPIELGAEMRALQLSGMMLEATALARAVVFDKIIPVHRYASPIAAYLLLKLVKDSDGTEGELDEADRKEILEKSKELIDEVEALYPYSSMLLVAKSYYQFIEKDYPEASDTIIEVLDDNQKNTEAIIILKDISKEAAEYYEKKREDGTITEDEKLELAWSYFRLEDIDPIIPVLDTIEPNDDIFYGYNNLYGRCYSQKEEFEKAEPYLAKWIEMMNDMRKRSAAGEELSKKDKSRVTRAAFCYYMYAQCLDHLKKTDEAEKYYKQAIELSFEDGTDMNEELFYRESLGKMLHKEKKYPAAMEVWNAMIERIDHCVPAYIHRQETAHAMHDAQLVIDDYYNIIRDFPSYGKAYGLAAKVFIIYKQFEDAKTVFERASEAEVDSDMLDWMRCRIMEVEKKLEDAEKLYLNIEQNVREEKSDITDTEVLDFYSDLVAFYMNLRDENNERNHLEEAEKYLEEGFKHGGPFKRLFWLKTDIEEFSGRKADSVYKEMLQYFPGDAAVFFEYGEYLRRDDRIEEAEQMYMKALDMDPENNRVNNRLMDIWQDRYNDYEKREAYDKAVAYATRQLELVDDEYYRIERLLLYLDGGELDKAEEDAKTAIDMKDDNVYGHNGLGLVHLRRREYPEAIACFKRALEVMEDKETPVPYTNLSKVYEQMGDFENAAKLIEQAMEIFGKNLSNRYSLARIYVKGQRFEEAMELYDEMQNIYRERLSETHNKWNASSVVKYLIKMVDVANLSGNDQLAQNRLNVLNAFLKEQGYTNKGLDEVTIGNERKVAADIFRQLGDFYLNNQRQYKVAIQYFEKCIRFMMKGGTKGPSRSIVDDVNVRNSIFKKSRQSAYVEKPENIDGADLKNIGDMYRFFAMACFNYGLKEWSVELAQRSMNCFRGACGDLNKYLTYPTSSPLRRSDMAMLLFMTGDTEGAIRMADSVETIPPCEFCTYGACYDRILTLARIYEMSGNIPKAVEYYKMAYEKTKDDAEIYVALRTLDGRSSVK